MEDVVEELKELQKLCQDRERLLGHLDYGPIPSFEKIQSELNTVLERCMTLTERHRSKSGLTSVKNCFIAWVRS